MEYKNNVIKFPKNDDSLPCDASELRERITSVRTTYAEEISDEALEAMISIFRNYGFYTQQEKMYPKDLVAISEMMKSTLLRYVDIDHPMQKVVDQVIEIGPMDIDNIESD